MRSWDRCVHTLRLSCQVLDSPGGQKSCVHWPVTLPWLSCVRTVRVTTHPSGLLTQPCPRLSCASCHPALWQRLSQDAEEGTRLWGHACSGPCSSQRLRWDWGQVSQPWSPWPSHRLLPSPGGVRGPLLPHLRPPRAVPSSGPATLWLGACSVVVSVGALLWADDGVGARKPQKEGQGSAEQTRASGWTALVASWEWQPPGNCHQCRIPAGKCSETWLYLPEPQSPLP